MHPNGYHYTLNAGSAHGLAVGDEITIYPSEAAVGKHTLGTLLVGTIANFSSTLNIPTGKEKPSFTTFAVAMRSSQGQRKILKIQLPFIQGSTLNLLHNTIATFPNILTVLGNAHLTVFEAHNKGKLLVQITDPTVIEHGGPPLWFRNGATITLEEFPQFLAHTLNYQWELDRTNLCHPLCCNIQIEIYKLQYKESQISPNHYDLFPINSDNLYYNGVIHFKASNDTLEMYGIKITNNTDYEIYPQLHYFNPELLSIGMLLFCLLVINI